MQTKRSAGGSLEEVSPWFLVGYDSLLVSEQPPNLTVIFPGKEFALRATEGSFQILMARSPLAKHGEPLSTSPATTSESSHESKPCWVSECRDLHEKVKLASRLLISRGCSRHPGLGARLTKVLGVLSDARLARTPYCRDQSINLSRLQFCLPVLAQ